MYGIMQCMKQAVRQQIRLLCVFLLALVMASEPVEFAANLFPCISFVQHNDTENASEETDDDFRVSVNSIQKGEKSNASPFRLQSSNKDLHYFKKNRLIPEKTGDAAALISHIHFQSGDLYSDTL